MDVTKAPPVDPGVVDRGSPAAPAQQQLPPPMTAAPVLDRVDIQPLDLTGALLILIAEVRAGLPLLLPLPLLLEGHPPLAPGAVQLPGQVPQGLVRLFLASLPDDALLDHAAPDALAAWANAAAQSESALTVALDKGVAAVAAWRDVPAAVVAGVEDTRSLVVAVVGGESVNAEWLRPEWLGLAPRLERYWRRRRAVRRGLSNPDHESEQERRDGRDDERDDS